MKRLRKVLHLTSSDRRLLVSTALLLGTIRLGLRLFPFRTLRRVVARLAQAPAGSHRTNRSSVDRLVWAVGVASQYVPRATCLTQALATQVLLGRHGHPSRLRVGVARGEEGRLEAHAWVENRGKVIVGGGELSRYTLLPDMESQRP
ncbi:MAG: lasso peptide biosynthesis B2 protein [Rubrobacter sp.]|nr:lasso peptide biosynthesis B2 protein [Rubrobacter sp.]